MSFDALAFPITILTLGAALILLISHDWRLTLSALGVVYMGVFVLTALSWPLEMAVVKLVTGWIAASVLGIGQTNLSSAQKTPLRYWPSEIVFRVAAAGLVILVAFSLVPSVLGWLPEASFVQTLGGLTLVGLGVLHLGFTAQPLRTIVGLLTVLAGFEVIYATMESSVLVAGFLAVINMGLALVGAYLLLVPDLEVEE